MTQEMWDRYAKMAQSKGMETLCRDMIIQDLLEEGYTKITTKEGGMGIQHCNEPPAFLLAVIQHSTFLKGYPVKISTWEQTVYHVAPHTWVSFPTKLKLV